MNWMVIACVILVLYIVWAFVVPPKAVRDRFAQEDLLKLKKDARTYVRDVVKGIAINATHYERGHTSGILTKRTPQLFIFNGIIRGDFSETVYMNIDQDGIIKEYETDIAAKAAFKAGDYGIVALTVSEGQIRFRDVCPPGVDARDMFKVRFNFMTSS